MNADDGNNRSIIVKLSEARFPELFDNAGGGISAEILQDKEYFNKKTGNIDYADILGLPTERLNSFVIKNEMCADANRKIAEAAKNSPAAKNKRIAGMIGSSGIFTEPFSEISFTELISAYDEQVNALKEFADLYIINNITTMSDMRAALLSCKKTEKPVYVIICPTSDMSDETVGISALGGLVTAQKMGASAFGIACADKSGYEETIKELSRYAKIPLIADLENQGGDMSDFLLSQGVEYFLCETDKADIVEKIKYKKDTPVSAEPLDDFFVFTHYADVFFLEPDTTEISEPINCFPDMEEVISEACKTACDVLCVEINSTDDAIDFSRNAHMSSLPVMFLSENVIALKMALMLYQGIALIDSSTLIPKKELEKICKKYGAAVY